MHENQVTTLILSTGLFSLLECDFPKMEHLKKLQRSQSEEMIQNRHRLRLFGSTAAMLQANAPNLTIVLRYEVFRHVINLNTKYYHTERISI